jgi:NarL family two-component system sensor histidine kinase LiaS|tara:strand:+ start:463 stop:1302 length:840 start_codon:yes stop_codon:yes gene_type:complete
LQELKKIVLGQEFYDKLQKVKSSKTKKLNSQLEIEKTKSKLLSLILLLIGSSSFVYLIYYTDKKSREKSSNKIIAAKKINTLELAEKNKISEQLHDNIGGSLAALKMRLSQLNDPNYYQALRTEINNLELIYNEVRDLSHELNSEPKFTSSFYEKLDISINKITKGFSSKSINIFPKKQINSIMNPNLQNAILLSCQELITNVIKHSKAEIINIDIAAHKDKLTIIVVDNGIGFDHLEKKAKLGFSQIKARTILYDGRFDIDSNKNNGTTITASFNLNN